MKRARSFLIVIKHRAEADDVRIHSDTECLPFYVINKVTLTELSKDCVIIVSSKIYVLVCLLCLLFCQMP